MLPAKREQFVQAWLETGSKSEAYRQAYNVASMGKTTIHSRASELSKMPEVQERYQELMKAGQERTLTTIQTIDSMLKTAYRMAEELEQPAQMVSAATALAKLHGLNVEKGSDSNRIMQVVQNVVIADRRDIPPNPMMINHSRNA